MADDLLAVSVQGVTQRFSLHHEKTLKGLVVNAVLRRHKVRESFLALHNVNLDIPVGATVGLIGHNGSGKSTLLKAIGGVITPTEGRVERRGRLSALLELKAGFAGELSGRENVMLNAQLLGLSNSQIRERFGDIVAFSGVEEFIDTPVKFYSSGMFARLGFALAIHTDPDVLLVDEVLAVGDEKFQAQCLAAMRGLQREGCTIVLVSHSMADVANFCDTVTLLHHGEVRMQGDPGAAIARYRQLMAESDTLERGSGRAGTPTGFVRVSDARAWSESGAPMDQLSSGETIHVEATFTPEQPAPNFVGRLRLLDDASRLLHGTSTERLGLHTGPLTEPITVRFTLPDLPLTGGRYRVCVEAAANMASPPWHRIPEAARIHVKAFQRGVGPLLVATTVRPVTPEITPGSRVPG